MKRAIAFVTALVIVAGAVAPATSVFADDYIPDHIPLTDIYADPTLYDLYVSPYYNNLSFAEWGDYATDCVISGFPMDTVKQVEATAGGLESLWNVVHDAFSFGYNIGQDWVSKLYVDTSDGRLKSDGNIMTDDLKALLDQYFKIVPSPDRFTTASGGVWIKCPFNYSSYRLVGSSSSQGVTNTADIYVSILRLGAVAASYYAPSDPAVYFNYAFINSTSGAASFAGGGALSNTFTYNSTSYKVANNSSDFFRSVFGSFSGYSNYTEAFNDFYGYVLDTDPIWNGDGYYRDDYIVDVALPAIPAIDWEDLNNNYYTEYGGDFVEGDVNNFYYDISYNYFPAEYTYTIPYWLIDGNTNILDFNYTLELPTAELSTLPEDFEGGSNFWNSSFGILGGFGAFVLLGLSFALVSLFFND